MASEREQTSARGGNGRLVSQRIGESLRSSRSQWRLSWLTGLALLLLFGITACRELTAPTQSNPATFLAQAQVLDASEKPASGVHVEIHPSSEELASTFSVKLVTDDEGRFSVWIPNVPLTVSFRPELRSTLPNEDRENVLFFQNEVKKFVLRGQYHVGIVGPTRYADSLVARLVMSTHVDRIGGGQDGLAASTSIKAGGSFEIFLPQAGRFAVRLLGCCDLSVQYDWPDSLEVASEDTIRLELPFVSYNVRLTLGGNPVPVGELSLGTTFSSSSHNDVAFKFQPDGQAEIFEGVGLPGATRIEVEPYLSTAVVGSPIVSGNPGVLSFSPFAASIPPLNEGDLITVELGQYELQVQVLDPQGEPLPLVRVELMSESWYNERVTLDTDDEGRAVFGVNPNGHQLLLSAYGFLQARRYFTVTGDMQMTVTMQPLPAKN